MLAVRVPLRVPGDHPSEGIGRDIVGAALHEQGGTVDDLFVDGLPEAVPRTRRDLRADAVEDVPLDVAAVDLRLHAREVGVVDERDGDARLLGEGTGIAI